MISVRAAVTAIPTTWLDPLLTGPDTALRGSGPWDGPDIERLLTALRTRLLGLHTYPEHLFLGTAADNAADMIAKGRARPFGKNLSPNTQRMVIHKNA